MTGLWQPGGCVWKSEGWRSAGSGNQMGAQVNRRQAEKILSYVELAKKEGATVACGGDFYTENGCDKGSFIQPTLITNVTNDMRVAQEVINLNEVPSGFYPAR